MSELSLQQKKQLERHALITNLKKYNKAEATDSKGQLKEGFYQLQSGAYVYPPKNFFDADSNTNFDVMAKKIDETQLHDCKNLAFDGNGKLKSVMPYCKAVG